MVKGFLAKVIQDSKNRILGEGDHLIESTDFEFVGFEDVTKTNCIQHGTITILRVTKGKIALAWKDNDPIFISEPGMYEFDSPDFAFDSFRLVCALCLFDVKLREPILILTSNNVL